MEAVILSSGLQVKNAASPVGKMPAPVDFLATMGALEGEVKLKWARVHGAVSYIGQQSPHVMPRTWTQTAISPNSSAVATNSTSGQTFVFRVAAVGAAGQARGVMNR